jgi:hypothetical protein
VKLNKLDQALAGSHEALCLAHELAYPYTLVVSLYGVAVLHWLRREVQAVHERNETLLTHAQEQDFPTWIAWGMALRGWILAMQGQAERGMAQVRQVLPLEHAASVPSWPFALVRAEVYRVSGYAGEGLRLLAEALAVVDKTDVRDFEVEIYRLQGELLLAQLRIITRKLRPVCPGHSLSPAVSRRKRGSCGQP